MVEFPSKEREVNKPVMDEDIDLLCVSTLGELSSALLPPVTVDSPGHLYWKITARNVLSILVCQLLEHLQGALITADSSRGGPCI